MKSLIEQRIRESAQVKLDILKCKEVVCVLERAIQATINCFKNGNKMLLCGNGGSAADAQHLAAELTGRFYKDRKPLPAQALHVNTSYLTAVANDYDYDDVYKRATESFGKKGDVIVALSTSGNSKNVIRALEAAKSIGMINVGFAGRTGGMMQRYCDYLIKVPSDGVARIQENHITLGHILCEVVESSLFDVRG